MKIGLLTSGGDCPGLNAVMRAFVKYAKDNIPKAEIYGFLDGYTGLIEGKYKMLDGRFFDDLLFTGGTVLGSIRQPFKSMTSETDDGVTKLDKMVANYKELGLDCLITIGGAGTHKTAYMLSAEGCNVIGVPKTIDNDIVGTDCSFGFDTAAEVAAECVRNMHATAYSHGRVMIIEVMGNKTGWIALHSAVAGGAHIALLPELPYDENTVIDTIAERRERGERYDIIVVAEGAMTMEESKLKRKEMLALRKLQGYSSAAQRLVELIGERLKVEVRLQTVGYLQRGVCPNAHDRALCTVMGAYAANLAKHGKFGVTVALSGGRITYNSLADVAGQTKFITQDNPLLIAAESTGISFGR